jgi:acetyl esterase/lipase
MFVMRERGRRPVSAVALTASVLVTGLLAGCGAGATTGASAPPAVSPSTVVVRSDVTYATPVPADWLPATLDVYASPGAKSSPLVVFLHGGGATKTDLQYPEIAKALAARGAVVLVPNWGPTVFPGGRKDAGWTASAIVKEQRGTADEVACAVAFAVAHAGDYGADPTRLVLAGHSAGASEAGEVALTPTGAFPGCAVAPAPATPRGIMLWDGDWLMADTSLDVIGADLGALVPAYSPWPALGTARTTATVELAITPNSRTAYAREATTTSDWLTWRDPTGAMTKDLAKIKAFHDGAVDIVDVTEGFSAGLADHGIKNSILQLADPATGHTYLAPVDIELLLDHVLRLGT